MKYIKQLLISSLLLLLCLSMLAGCGSTEVPPSTPDDNQNQTPVTPPAPQYDIITIARALELCGESGNLTTERYYLRATVVSVDDARFGAMTIQDETGTIGVYNTASADGTIGYADMADKPYKGDTVLLHCTLQNFNGKKEVKSAYLISFEKADNTVNAGDYTDMTIAEARDAATGTKVKVDGVVARITYASGQAPAGVMLVDDTQSIYVYDNELAGRVKIGNTVTILASKTYWILDTERASAEKFGYRGCCQLEDVTVVDVDPSVKDFDRTWIPSSTVKNILETPVTENITTTIYRVNARVRREDGKGFINYYFDDLDGKTGTYTYTQCNGSDFAWLDEFDGKICTVYLTALNAKSTSSDCYFRVIPIDVKDEGFTFNLADTAKHVVEYYGVDQFNASYTGDPAAEMITSVSSTLLGFENATLSYTSSDTKVVYFEEANGKVIFHCGEEGFATITITGSYNGTTYQEKVTVSVGGNADVDTITIREAQQAAVGDMVTVRGVVGPSLVNKTGFYLFDETGMIAVIVDASVFDEIEIGHEIILTAKRDCFKDAGKTHAGETCLTGGTLVANFYGKHAYNDSFFITDKTLADIYNLNVNEDHTTEVYVVKATVNYVETGYYTKLTLKGDGVELSLYCSSADQYAFLNAYAGQEVTLEIAPCNWNNKTFYVGCVLAIRTQDGKIINDLNFQ